MLSFDKAHQMIGNAPNYAELHPVFKGRACALIIRVDGPTSHRHSHLAARPCWLLSRSVQPHVCHATLR